MLFLNRQADLRKMNDPISWDPSLVKKFSSSNHYKLLNQLRNEVKKYPLNNKKKTAPTLSRNSNTENNNQSNNIYDQTISPSKTVNNESDVISSKSTVSFNNAKNFSIYNNNVIKNTSSPNDIELSNQTKSNDHKPSASFKDRLNEVDMK